MTIQVAIHHSKVQLWVTNALKQDLRMITSALSLDWVQHHRPIAHMVDRDPSGRARSDSSLDAAGGYSVDMQFFWYLAWPETVRRNTLRYVTRIRAEDGTITSINVLEYAAIIITKAAATHFFTKRTARTNDPYPTVFYEADNSTAESWAVKGCKCSPTGRALGRLDCALMINNPVGQSIGHVSSEENKIADRLSRAKSESHLQHDLPSLFQDYPELRSCLRFHPSPELLSSIMDALLFESYIDPLEASRRILNNPGRTTTSDSQH